MSAFSIYLLGACISGFIFMVLTNINSFYEYMCKSIDESKNDMKNSGEYDITEIALLDSLDNNMIIYFLNAMVAILSWIGLLLILLYVISWIIEKFNN